MLEKFAEWFASKGGVWQTAAVVLGFCLVERLAGFDSNGFWLLYWLTVYSAVTQPVLAYCSRIAAEKTDRDLAAIKVEEDQILAANCDVCGGHRGN